MSFQVRDNRGGNWFWLHNAIHDRYGTQLGPYGGWVYSCICRHASSQEQSTWVSQRLIQEQTGISERKIQGELRRLEQLGFIRIETRKDDRGQQSNVYTLLALSDDDARHAGEGAHGAQGGASDAGGLGTVCGGPGQEVPTMNKTQLTKPNEQERGTTTKPLSNGAVHHNDYASDRQGNLWQMVLTDLQEQMVPANFTRWVARTALLSHEPGAAVVGVPDQVSADQLAKRFDPLVRRALADACGEPVTVQYQVVEG